MRPREARFVNSPFAHGIHMGPRVRWARSRIGARAAIARHHETPIAPSNVAIRSASCSRGYDPACFETCKLRSFPTPCLEPLPVIGRIVAQAADLSIPLPVGPKFQAIPSAVPRIRKLAERPASEIKSIDKRAFRFTSV